MARLFIIIISYSVTIFALPRWAPFDALNQWLVRITSHNAFIVNVAALIAASGFLYLILRKPGGWIYSRPSGLLQIMRTGLIGIVFAALYALFEAISGYSISVTNLLIIPIAFLMGETAYVLACKIWPSLGGPPSAETEVDLHLDASQPPIKGPPRLLVTLPIYVLIMVYLPQQQDFRNLEAQLVNVTPSISFAISVLALILAAGLAAHLLKRKSSPTSLTNQTPPDHKSYHLSALKLNLGLTLCLGMAIAALINIVGFVIGYAPSLVLLIIMTLGFTIAEAVYLAISWRMTYGPPD